LPGRQQLRRADDGVQPVEIQHLLAQGRRRAVPVQRPVVALQRVRHRARRAARKDDDAKTELPQFAALRIGVLPPSTMLASSGMRDAKAAAGGAHLLGVAQGLDEEGVHPVSR
jgi:hypothetical protein